MTPLSVAGVDPASQDRAGLTDREEAPAEQGTLAVFQYRLFTPDHARTFADEFAREMNRLSRHVERSDDARREHLAVVTVETANLNANMLTGVISETLTKLIVAREAEKQRLEAQIRLQASVEAIVLSMPEDLVTHFTKKGGGSDGDAQKGEGPRRGHRDPVASYRERDDLPGQRRG